MQFTPFGTFGLLRSHSKTLEFGALVKKRIVRRYSLSGCVSIHTPTLN